jgi:uncharacterized protein involved in tellurium resistance
VDVEEEQPEATQVSQPTVARPTVQAPTLSVEPTIPIINLAKIELIKKQSINIKKYERITATLEWETNKDLDLYCFYVMKNGSSGKVYYRDLGNADHYPYIKLDGDAQRFGRETIEIYKTDELTHVMFAAYSG